MKTKTKKKKSVISTTDILHELQEVVSNKSNEPRQVDVGILFDEKYTKQYSLKIPKKMAQLAQIDVTSDKFRFIVTLPDNTTDKPNFRGELIRK